MENVTIALVSCHIVALLVFSAPGGMALVCTSIFNERTPDTGQLPAGGSCCFNYTLCAYTQGFRHTAMTNWTVTDKGAVAKQEYSGAGSSPAVHSDLESPLLSLYDVCCVEFKYFNYLPSTLSVIGFWNETDHELFDRPLVHNTVGRTILITVPRDIKMLKFRAYGGGGVSTGESHAALHYVTFHLGGCGPECNFTSSPGQLPTLCGWETNGWEAVLDQDLYPVARLNNYVAAGTLTTGLVMATPTGGICVMFYYMIDVNDTVSMLIQKAGDSRVIPDWVSTNNGTQSVKASAAVSVFSDSAFKLVFSGKRCNNLDSQIAIFNVTSTPITSTLSPCRQLFLQPAVQIPQYEGCMLNPSTTTTTEISPSSTSVTGKPVTTNPKPSSSGHITSADVATEGGGATLSTHSATGKATDTTLDAQPNTDVDNTGVVVGSALAGIGVIGAAVIVTVVVWRKRKQKRRGAEDKNVLKSKMVDLQQSGSLHGNKAGHASQNTYSETRNPTFSPSLHSAGDYTEVTGTEHTDNPYDDAAPDNADLTPSDGYSHVDILGADKKKQRTSITNPYELARAMPSADTCTDEYHHLSLQPGATKPKVNSARSPTQPDYSHIGGHSKLQPQDVYSVPSVQDVYSVPATAAANQQEDEYNRINSKQLSGTKRQGDATPDVYNRLGHVNAAFDEGTDAAEGEYNKVGEKIPTSKQPRGATRDDYDRIDGVFPPDGNPGGFEKGKTGEESDQYNTLNFDEGEQRRQNAASDKKMTQPRKAYDHVQDEFQDMYAKTQRDKRERVVDSNYDHVTPDETRVN